MNIENLSEKSLKVYKKLFQFSKYKLSFFNGYLLDHNVREMSGRLKSLEGKYKGHRCFIMGNGPSLNKMDLELLKNEFVWCSNKIYLLFDKISWRPTFYTAVDTRVVPDIANEIVEQVNNLTKTQFFFPVQFRYKNILNSESNVYWFPESRKTDTFSLNASKWVAGVRTVTISALQLAVYMGFNPIYLIGCDTSYRVPTSVKFDGGSSDLLISVYDDDPNHFDNRYFGANSKWHDPHVDRMIKHYQISKEICDLKNVKVYNATVGGNLDVFPRVNYIDLF
jgi:hypothetical protein